MYEHLLASLIVGLLGAGHCLGMCGGISSALAFAIPEDKIAHKWLLLLFYNIGRITSYTCIGALAGFLGAAIQNTGIGVMSGLSLTRVAAGLLLVMMGFYVADWWRALTLLERIGHHLWRYIQPLGTKLMPVTTLPKALFLGLVWGWLPCGLVYSALVLATTQSGPWQGAAVMAAFGLGTLPAVLLGGIAASAVKALLAKRSVKQLMGGLLILFGAWTLAIAFKHAGHVHSDHSAHSGDHSAYSGDHSAHSGDHSAHSNHPTHNAPSTQTAEKTPAINRSPEDHASMAPFLMNTSNEPQ